MRAIGYETMDTFTGGDLAAFGELLTRQWKLKFDRSPTDIHHTVDGWIRDGIAAGAAGGKLVGAGGGGFLLFYAEEKAGLRLAMDELGLPEVRFGIDYLGIDDRRRRMTRTVVVLAGGLGTRVAHLTGPDLPKALLPVGGQPVHRRQARRARRGWRRRDRAPRRPQRRRVGTASPRTQHRSARPRALRRGRAGAPRDRRRDPARARRAPRSILGHLRRHAARRADGAGGDVRGRRPASTA